MTEPLVLVVEDDPDALELRVRQLESAGCRAIAVSNPEDAIREVWHTPLLGGVLTDINLVRSGDDKSGIALARYIRTNRPNLPVSGYSGVFAEDRLTSEELQLFDRYYSAGRLSAEQIRSAMSEVSELAHRFEQVRRDEADRRLDNLRRREGLSAEEFDTFRRLVPDHELATEQVLAQAELHARIVGPGELPSDLSDEVPELASKDIRLRTPIVVWIREDSEGGAEAEIHGVPELYAYGKDASTAIRAVIELAVLFFQDLENATDIGDQAARLRAFLLGVFVRSDGESGESLRRGA